MEKHHLTVTISDDIFRELQDVALELGAEYPKDSGNPCATRAISIVVGKWLSNRRNEDVRKEEENLRIESIALKVYNRVSKDNSIPDEKPPIKR